jgi:hypothetical protein
MATEHITPLPPLVERLRASFVYQGQFVRLSMYCKMPKTCAAD